MGLTVAKLSFGSEHVLNFIRMIKQLGYICIHTEDLAETERFYCEILGLEKRVNFRKKQGVDWVLHQTGQQHLY